MEKVKKMVEAGASIPTAIKEALAQAGLPSLNAFAVKHGLLRPVVTNQINGRMAPTDPVISALVAELGGAADEWRELLWLAAKPSTLSA